MKSFEEIEFTINYLMNTWTDLSKYLLQNPQSLLETQFKYWQDYQKLFFDLSNGSMTQFDKRFQHSDWQQNILFNFMKQSYLLIYNHIDNLVKQVEMHDEKIGKKLRFYTHQFLDATSPTNFPGLNPEILAKSFETHGENLRKGFKQFLDDLMQGQGQLNIKMTDINAFKIGENIAYTKGDIIYQNDLMQLIQYQSTTDTAFQIPLLIIPPWINKYYILDLQEENSLVKWLVDQGFTVFMISWVNPTSQHREKQFSDYMFEGPLAALKCIEKITGNIKTNLIGYCIGGTLLGCMLAYLTAKKIDCIESATYLTTLLDFSEPGELGVFIDEKQIAMLESYMKINGYIDGHIMAAVFSALRANDLIWSNFVNNYLKGENPKPFDLLYWNSDSTNIPEPVHSFYLRNMYLNNFLTQPNKLIIDDVPLDLSKISVPSYFLAAQDDHIVPWKSSFYSKNILTNSSVKFVLTSSGHVAGVVNPPHKNKYGYWTNNSKTNDPDTFFAEAVFHKGSWWNDWAKWLIKLSGEQHSINNLNLNEINVIEKAPGAYVKQSLMERYKDKLTV